MLVISAPSSCDAPISPSTAAEKARSCGHEEGRSTTQIGSLRLAAGETVTWIPLIWGRDLWERPCLGQLRVSGRDFAPPSLHVVSGSLLAATPKRIQRLLRPRDRRDQASPTADPFRGDLPGKVRVQIWVLLLRGLPCAGASISWAGNRTRCCCLTRPGRIAGQLHLIRATAEAQQNGWLATYDLGVMLLALPGGPGGPVRAAQLWTQPCHPGLQLAGRQNCVGQRLHEP